MTDEITPVRLRELAKKHEIYAGVETTWALSMDTAAALRAAADEIDFHRTNAALTLRAFETYNATLAAREALLRRAGMFIYLCLCRDDARALAAEIAAALGKETDQ